MKYFGVRIELGVVWAILSSILTVVLIEHSRSMLEVRTCLGVPREGNMIALPIFHSLVVAFWFFGLSGVVFFIFLLLSCTVRVLILHFICNIWCSLCLYRISIPFCISRLFVDWFIPPLSSSSTSFCCRLSITWPQSYVLGFRGLTVDGLNHLLLIWIAPPSRETGPFSLEPTNEVRYIYQVTQFCVTDQQGMIVGSRDIV